MRYTYFYTIKEPDYNTIELSLANEKISPELKNNIQKLIADHKALIKAQKEIIKEQIEHATGIFALFEDPISQQGIENNSLQNQPENKVENLPTPFPDPKPKKRALGGKNKLPQGNIITRLPRNKDLQIEI